VYTRARRSRWRGSTTPVCRAGRGDTEDLQYLIDLGIELAHVLVFIRYTVLDLPPPKSIEVPGISSGRRS